MLETETYAVLSTAHLSPQTPDNLNGTGLICDQAEARIRVRLPQPSDPLNATVLTPDLAAAIAFVQKECPHAYGIMFDRDGPIHDTLPAYHWL
jgi:hypothetical protein